MSKDQIRALLERVSGWLKQAQEELVRAMTEIEARYGRIYLVDDDERAPSTSSARITPCVASFSLARRAICCPALPSKKEMQYSTRSIFTYYTRLGSGLN